MADYRLSMLPSVVSIPSVGVLIKLVGSFPTNGDCSGDTQLG